MSERAVQSDMTPGDQPEASLRPQFLTEFIGQARACSNLKVFIDAARARAEALDHTLFVGPPGLGKTTLAQIVARELGVNFRATSGPVIAKAGDLAALLTNLESHDVLFIDEIHRMGRVVEVSLYPAMEDYVIDIVVDQGPHGRSIQIPLQPFTLVGATTRTGMLTSPLRDRFAITQRLQFYTPDEVVRVLKRSAGVLGVDLDDDGAHQIAQRSRQTPRVANRLLARARDYAQVRADGTITVEVACDAMDLLQVDLRGLDETDRMILGAIIDKFDGGPVGLETLAASIHEDADTIMDVWEPYLLQLGFLDRTPRGRVATRLAHEYMGRPYSRPEPSDQARFTGL